jgi:hypothetical protein
MTAERAFAQVAIAEWVLGAGGRRRHERPQRIATATRAFAQFHWGMSAAQFWAGGTGIRAGRECCAGMRTSCDFGTGFR